MPIAEGDNQVKKKNQGFFPPETVNHNLVNGTLGLLEWIRILQEPF